MIRTQLHTQIAFVWLLIHKMILGAPHDDYSFRGFMMIYFDMVVGLFVG